MTGQCSKSVQVHRFWPREDGDSYRSFTYRSKYTERGRNTRGSELLSSLKSKKSPRYRRMPSAEVHADLPAHIQLHPVDTCAERLGVESTQAKLITCNEDQLNNCTRPVRCPSAEP